MLGTLHLALSAALVFGQDVTPAPDLTRAFERAAEESRRLVLGVYTAGEARSEDFVKRSLKDKAVKAALGDVVFVQALVGAPSKADAKRFGGHDVDTHRGLERALRDHVPANAEGVLATPQHVWFGPDGKVLLAAPFELDPAELLWLDWRSKRLAGDAAAVLPAGARAPRRYLEREAFVPADGDRFGRGLLPDEVDADLETLRRRGQAGGGGGRGGFGGGGGGNWTLESIEAFVRLAFTDVQDAQDEVRNELGNVFLRLGGSTALLESGLELVAFVAPASGLDGILPFVSDNSPALRARTAAILESLGFAGVGWPELRKALDKEEDPVTRRAQLRAVGVVGRNDAGARRLLEKEATKAASPLDRAAALIGLGHIGDGAGLEAPLREGLGSRDTNIALAAAAAMALTRDSARFRAAITERAGGATEEAALFEATLAVLDGAPVVRLRPVLQKVAPDDFPRTRLFFESRPPEGARGGAMGGGRGRDAGAPGGTGGGGTGGGGGGR